MPSMNATCSSVHLSNVVDLTLDMCTPNPRCDPLQLVQKNLIQLEGHLTVGKSSLGGARFTAYIPKTVSKEE